MKKLFIFALALLLAVGAQAASYSVNLSTLTGNYTASGNGDVTTITGTLMGTSKPYKISIADGGTVILENVIIDGSHSVDCAWAGITCEGNATIELKGANSVHSFHTSYPGIFVPKGKTLTIQGTGYLHAKTLLRDEDGYLMAAGIGAGDYGKNAGNIIIKSGTIDAIGASGIGGAWEASCGNITILGGNITATSDYWGAAIGSGGHSRLNTNRNADGGNITISGGTIFAIGCTGSAGIGSGSASTCGNITITGGTVTAVGGKDGAGIGAGYTGHCGDIKISNVNRVTAVKGMKFAGVDVTYAIGMGNSSQDNNSTCGNITIGGTSHPGGVSESPYFYPQTPNYKADDGWMYYDNGNQFTAFGPGSGTFYWAVMYPAYTLNYSTLSKIGIYMSQYNTDNIYVYVISGGSSPISGLSIYTGNVTPTLTSGMQTLTLNQPVAFDNTQNLWIVLSAPAGWPATVCSNTGDPNSRWYSMDGISWADLAETQDGQGHKNNYSFMIRAYFDANEAVEEVMSYPSPATNKIIRDGQLYIIRDNRLYTPTGTQVK